MGDAAFLLIAVKPEAALIILPVTFIVNRKGELELTLVGPQTEEEIIKLLSL